MNFGLDTTALFINGKGSEGRHVRLRGYGDRNKASLFNFDRICHLKGLMK